MATMKLGSKAEAFQLEGQTWRCLTELASDVVIEVGEMSFNLHKADTSIQVFEDFKLSEGMSNTCI
ncbi:hypothetical protein C4D60_Mb09t18650 [Musa balbisiana]|uniref:Uncharacterized protein n=1 Tax=Musa balbisiana TaxID=52838 RepID=A0A4S8IIR5_MUSBA|nr:hypothetical protein C4D60_Mb09t18650 [Musa balbisiana]